LLLWFSIPKFFPLSLFPFPSFSLLFFSRFHKLFTCNPKVVSKWIYKRVHFLQPKNRIDRSEHHPSPLMNNRLQFLHTLEKAFTSGNKYPKFLLLIGPKHTQ
jgi:hypothetical protein